MKKLMQFFYVLGVAVSFFFFLPNAISQSEHGHEGFLRLLSVDDERLHPTLIKTTNRQSIEVLGEQLVFRSPPNYCGLIKHGAELELFEDLKKTIKENRLLLVLVRCDELGAFRKGKKELFDHWILIQLISIKGEFRKLDVSREVFLRGVSQGSKSLNPADLQQRINSLLKDRDFKMEGFNYKAIGRDANAFYFSLKMKVADQNRLRDVHCLAALALINGLPLGIYVYEAVGSMENRRDLAKTLQATMVSILENN